MRPTKVTDPKNSFFLMLKFLEENLVFKFALKDKGVPGLDGSVRLFDIARHYQITEDDIVTALV